ncbi:MAG: helix-turn-helix domain-containing protein [Phycisphaerae bacterium]|jgi:IclR family acetate operon transcriptional repressor|nr:helix-turn-helix domain-containing protein [Phycisphaerae bacterium]
MAKCPVEALNKGLKLLEVIARHPEGISLTELAEQMVLKVTTTHNLLKTLAICGYAVKMDDGRYRLGWKLPSLVRPGAAELDPEGPVVSAMRELARVINESIVLTSLVGGVRQVLLRIQGDQLVGINVEALDSSNRRIWQVVTGRILAAFCSKEELAEIVNISGLPGQCWNNIDTVEALEKQLAILRQEGLAENIEREAASVAMPVTFESGELFGALGAHLPKYRYDSENRERILKNLAACCQTLSLHLTK